MLLLSGAYGTYLGDEMCSIVQSGRFEFRSLWDAKIQKDYPRQSSRQRNGDVMSAGLLRKCTDNQTWKR